MSQAAVLAEPIPFEWHDPKRGPLALAVHPLDFAGESAVQRILEDRALKAVQRHREAMSVYDYELQMDGWRRDCATGAYEYGSMACFLWMHTASGWCYRAWLMLKASSHEVTQELVARIAEDTDKRKELDEKIKLANDPGRRRPAAAAAPGASPSPTPAPSSPGSPSALRPTSSAALPAAG